MKNWIKFLFFVVSTSLFSLNADVYSEYENKDILISPEEAIKLIGQEKVMFVSGDSGDVFKLGHIKGSVEMYAHHLHHADIMGNVHCSPLFQCIEDAEHHIGEKGITNDTLVIAYDDYKGPNATGVYHFFKSYGHEKVKLLNGGRFAITQVDPNQKIYDSMKDELSQLKGKQRGVAKYLKKFQRGQINLSEAQVAQLEEQNEALENEVSDFEAKLADVESKLLVVKGEEEVHHAEYHIDPAKIDISHVATKHDVKHAMDDILKNGAESEYVIVDTRGMIEIIGERKMDNVARGGHVPGATFLEWKHISDAENKRSFKNAEELKAIFEKFGITKDKKVYAYCHVGTGRSSEIITALQLLGYPYAKIFTGSWDTWGNDMNLPIKR